MGAAVLVSLVQFQNVDIYKRGFYRIRMRVCFHQLDETEPSKSNSLFKRVINREYFNVVDGDLQVQPCVFEVQYERQLLNLDWCMEFNVTSAADRSTEPIMIKLYLDYAETSGQDFKCVQKRRLLLTEFQEIAYDRILFSRKFESMLDVIVCRGSDNVKVPDHETVLALKHEYLTKSHQELIRNQIHAFASIDLKSASLDCSSHYERRFSAETRPLLSVYLDPASSISPLNNVDHNEEYGFKKFSDGTEYLKHIREYLSVTPNQNDVVHLIFCVPGLQGSHHDFRMMKNVCMLANKSEKERNVYWHICRENNGHSFDDINDQAANIVSEVKSVMCDKLFRDLTNVAVSFISYSLGGLVVRAALNHSDFPTDIRDRLHMFVTLATPHLGLWYNSNASLEALMNLSIKIKTDSQSIKQLLMQDHEQVTETFLYKLCAQSASLKQFKRCIFISSVNDLYVCNHSALMEIDKRAFGDAIRGNYHVQMCVNMIAPVDRVSVERILVNFDNDGRKHRRTNIVYEYLGRDEHLAYLQDYNFINGLAKILFP